MAFVFNRSRGSSAGLKEVIHEYIDMPFDPLRKYLEEKINPKRPSLNTVGQDLDLLGSIKGKLTLCRWIQRFLDRS